MGNLKGFQTRLTPTQKEELRHRYRAGESRTSLTRQFRCSDSAFWALVKPDVSLRRETRRENLTTKIHALTPPQLGWVAGIIDGEGYIGLVRYAGYHQPRIDVHSTTPAMQQRLHVLLGGHLGKKKRRGKERDLYCWSVWTIDHVERLLSVLLAHLVVKRRVASVVLEFCRRRQKTRYSAPTKKDAAAYRQVRALNRRGRDG